MDDRSGKKGPNIVGALREAALEVQGGRGGLLREIRARRVRGEEVAGEESGNMNEVR